MTKCSEAYEGAENADEGGGAEGLHGKCGKAVNPESNEACEGVAGFAFYAVAVFNFYVAEALGGAENETADVGKGVGVTLDFIGDEFAHDKETRGVERLGLADDGFCHFLVDPQVLCGVPVIAVNDVVAFFDFVDELEAFAGGRLSVVIEANDVIASSLSVTSHQCAVLTEIFGEADSLDVRVFGGKLLDDLPYVVGATVVDEYDFVFGAWARGDCFADFLDDSRNCVFATGNRELQKRVSSRTFAERIPTCCFGRTWRRLASWRGLRAMCGCRIRTGF